MRFGGYTLDTKAAPRNARVEWAGSNNSEGVITLIPSLEMELYAVPNNPAESASVSVNGQMTLGAWGVDASLMLLKTGLALIPGSSCFMPKEPTKQALILAALKASPTRPLRLTNILGSTMALLLAGDLVGARREFSQVSREFFLTAIQLFKDQGVACLAEGLADLLQKPAAVIKIGFEWSTWVPIALWDYWKYQGYTTGVAIEYVPPSTPTPVPPSPVPPPACVGGPALFDPPNGRTFWAKNSILRWKGYALRPGEVYEVRVWGQDGGIKLRADTADYNQKTGESKLDVNDLYAWGQGIYFWTVRVKDSSGNYVTCEGTPFWFRLNPRPDTGTITPQIITPSACPTSWSSC